MRQDLEDKWDEAEKTGEPIDVGNIVVCDVCNDDYTDSDEKGGFLFRSYAYCPKCAKKDTRTLKNMEKTEMTFSQFVLGLRGGNNTIQIRRLKRSVKNGGI